MKYKADKWGNIDLSSLTSLDPNVKLPDEIGGHLWLYNLTVLDPNVKLPDKIGGSLLLDRLNAVDKERLRKQRPDLRIR